MIFFAFPPAANTHMLRAEAGSRPKCAPSRAETRETHVATLGLKSLFIDQAA